ncbi:MAG: hypothetical protein GH151_10450 [Bacteroidetes bacterium]|nr:hypothetical protein [Bacteroidota bacterium]
MKDNKPYLFIFGALLLLIVLIVVLKKPFLTNDTEFAIKDLDEVTKIVLDDKNRTLTLEKKDFEWRVNNKYPARTNAIQFFLETLSRIKIKSPVSEEKFQEDIAENEITIVNVQIFRKAKLLRKYTVFKVNSNPYGNYVRMRRNSKPFIANIPGYSGNVGVFFITHESFWQPFTVFHYYTNEIASVKVEHILNPGLSFLIIQEAQGQYELYSLPDRTSIHQFDSVAVARYLTYFTNIQFDTRIQDINPVKKDSIFSSEPQYFISLTDKQGKETSVKIFPILIENKETQSGTSKIYDLNRVYAQINKSKDPVVFKYIVIDPILKDITYFLTKDNN